MNHEAAQAEAGMQAHRAAAAAWTLVILAAQADAEIDTQARLVAHARQASEIALDVGAGFSPYDADIEAACHDAEAEHARDLHAMAAGDESDDEA
jgi:hypothetical protein